MEAGQPQKKNTAKQTGNNRRCHRCLALLSEDVAKCPKCGLPIYTCSKSEEKPVTLAHLNMIEDPQWAGKPVVVEAVVSSTSIAYLCPKLVEAVFEEDDGSTFPTTIEIGERRISS